MSYYLANRDPRQLRRDVRSVVLGVVGFIVTMNVVTIIVVLVAAFMVNMESIMLAAGSMDQATMDALTDQVLDSYLETTMQYSGLGMLLGMICGLPWFFLVRGKAFLSSDAVKVNSKAKLGTILILLICVFGIQGFMQLITMVLEPLFNQGGGSLTDALEEGMESLTFSFWGVLYIVIIGPICEELVFRGGVMRKLEKYGANFAIIVSSLIFALYHMILFQAVFAFFIGIILAYTAGRFSLKWAVLLHIINNGLAVLPLYVGIPSLDTILLVIYVVSFVIAFVVLVVNRRPMKAQRQAGAPSEPTVYHRAFSSPWLIVYITLTTFVAVLLLGFF